MRSSSAGSSVHGASSAGLALTERSEVHAIRRRTGVVPVVHGRAVPFGIAQARRWTHGRNACGAKRRSFSSRGLSLHKQVVRRSFYATSAQRCRGLQSRSYAARAYGVVSF